MFQINDNLVICSLNIEQMVIKRVTGTLALQGVHWKQESMHFPDLIVNYVWFTKSSTNNYPKTLAML